MRIEITEENIIITPAPKKNKKNGLKICYWKEEKPEYPNLPIATTDLVKGQREYSIPDKFKYAIRSIEF